MESHRRAVVRYPWKLIRNLETGEVELYDLAADPEERVDRSEARADVLAECEGALEQWASQMSEGGLQGRKILISQQNLEQLRALGYAGR
jgi:hypothetical protein